MPATATRSCYYILNPEAGKGRGRKIESELLHRLKHSHVQFEFSRTKEPLHATELARSARESFDAVVAVGGDGTVNEVAAGLVGARAALGVISIGSGNDFAKMVHVPHEIPSAVSALQTDTIKQIDVGAAELTFANGTTTTKYFFNTLGAGFDAAVAYQVKKINWLTGLPLYSLALLRTIFSYVPHQFQIESATVREQSECFLVCIGNGNWEGGGFALTPHAIPDDNKFEVCIIKGKSPLHALKVVPKIFAGTHGSANNVHLFDTEELSIASSQPFPVHGDGEIFGLDVTTLRTTIKAKSLNVLVPQ